MGISYEPTWISKMLDDNPQPICSMVLEYVPTKLPEQNHPVL
jgi:hypothetical protein